MSNFAEDLAALGNFESKLSLRSLAKSFDKIGCASAIREQVLMALDLHYLCTHN